MRAKHVLGLSVLLTCLHSQALAAQDEQPDPSEQALSDLSIEQLAQLPVRSASKRLESLSDVPAALFVITGDDATSGGNLTLPEALRLAPNIAVQQVSSSEYAISARGFNGLQASNKLLALIDGRTIYTPLAASVYWQLHMPVMEDVQQIEVISGPGGTLYGPNAVNGVVNITSRDALDTIGTLVRGTAGSRKGSLALRHGLALGGGGAIRFYGQFLRRDGLPSRTGGLVDDDFRGWQAGFRSDFVTDRDHLTIQGDLFGTRVHTGADDVASGHNLIARWSRTLGASSSFEIQAYADRFSRQFILVDDSLQTMDVEGQLNLASGPHQLVAGAGLRTTRDEFVNRLNIFNLNPSSRRLWVGNIFLQDQIRLSSQLSLIAGLKVERSTFSGWQFLPNVRLAWKPAERHLLWTAVSRAVRTPSRIDRQLEAPPFLIAAPQFTSEKLVAFELGYRGQPTAWTSLSVNGFVNRYDDLRTTELVGGSFQLRNGKRGVTYGIEAWGSVQVAEPWRISLGASTLWKDLEDKPGRLDFAPRNSVGNDPEWQLTARSELDLGPRLSLTIDGRAVGPIRQAPRIGGYTELGGQLSFQLAPTIELFVAGRNLLHRTHLESNDPAAELAQRSILAGARSRF